ncbi:phosphoglycerate kinase, partial [Shewanella sp. C31]|nr:phosphoglycerate kinase [Shewanella electrica]
REGAWREEDPLLFHLLPWAEDRGIPVVALDGEAHLKREAEAFREALAGARTVFWNGPMGVFAVPPFDEGTLEVGRAVAALEGAFTVVGGG